MIRPVPNARMPASWAVTAALWIALSFPPPVSAQGFDDGFNAYMSGNYGVAFSAWRPLAVAGDTEAQFGLGLLYEKGRGVLRDLAAAASWYERAAVQGSMRAQTQLAGMYARGDGVAEDWTLAMTWWRRAAHQGSKRAQFHLGQAYEYGSAGEVDLDTALEWYDQAAVQGYNPAVQKAETIRRDREEAAKAQAASAASESATVPSDDFGSSSVTLSLAVPQSSSAIHETAADLATYSEAPLIALGINATRSLDKTYRIYLASYRSIQNAGAGWDRVLAANGDLLDGLAAAVAQTDLGRERGIRYRLQAGPLADTAAANALCYKLSRRSIPCVVVTP